MLLLAGGAWGFRTLFSSSSVRSRVSIDSRLGTGSLATESVVDLVPVAFAEVADALGFGVEDGCSLFFFLGKYCT